jgi:hypothetical protein
MPTRGEKLFHSIVFPGSPGYSSAGMMSGNALLASTVAGEFFAVWRSQRTPKLKANRSLLSTSPR